MARRLGQHFLTSRPLLARIAEAVCPTREDLTLEIGPGRGALTEYLLPRTSRLIAIEIDSALIAHLRDKFSGHSNLSLVEGDILEIDISQWGPVSVAGNLPYYITSPILEKIFELGSLLRRAVLLVQREVAERLTAFPGTRNYGFLTVHAQLYTHPEILFRVPPGAFSPPPKVDSAVIRLLPREHPELPDAERQRFLEFAGQCFRQKRKMLRSNLAGIYGRKRIENLPEASLRAEQLPLEQLISLYRRLGALPEGPAQPGNPDRT